MRSMPSAHRITGPAMPRILIVDDSADDRELIRLYLSKDADAWSTDFAVSGEDALERMRDVLPDVVVADLVMPGMSGIELLKQIRHQYPDVPVVITTGQGTEMQAVEALRRGAASYVPKTHLPVKLAETLKQVLDVADNNENYRRLVESLQQTTYRFELHNDPELFAPLVNLVQEMAVSMNACDETDRQRLGIALDEALLNALCHGSLELPAEELPDVRAGIREGRTVPAIKRLRHKMPFANRKIRVEADIRPEMVRVAIADEGPGFDADTLPPAEDPSTLDPDRGRGLALMRSFMDEVTFNDAGNEVTLVKRRGEAKRGDV